MTDLNTILFRLSDVAAEVEHIRDDLRELGCQEPEAASPPADMTLMEVAEKLRRSVSTVRGWCASGELQAYKLMGREWRVTPEALEAFLETQRKPKQELGKQRTANGPVELGAWRKVRGKDAA